jgi:hypothetical protein
MYPPSTPLRRSCAMCGRKEAAASMHLATVFEDGQPTRACDHCRDQQAWVCQNRKCRREQVGQQYLVNGLAFCAPCAQEAGVPTSGRERPRGDRCGDGSSAASNA